jgi:hypothetical protein
MNRVVVGETEQRTREVTHHTENTSTRRDQNGLRLVITKVNFINHNHTNPQSIRNEYSTPEPIYPRTYILKNYFTSSPTDR